MRSVCGLALLLLTLAVLLFYVDDNSPVRDNLGSKRMAHSATSVPKHPTLTDSMGAMVLLLNPCITVQPTTCVFELRRKISPPRVNFCLRWS